MYEKTVVIVNEAGLHARPAAVFVGESKKFKSKISIRNMSVDPSREGNAKSMLNVLTLMLTKGSEMRLVAEGEDEREAVDTLVRLIQNGCGEGA